MDAHLAVAISVAMHVAWNLIARHQPKDAFPLWWVLLAHLALLAPWGLWVLFTETQWTREFTALLTISAAANVIYFTGLAKAYERAPVSLVYPLVRSSPLLIAIWGSLFFGQHLPWVAWAGIAISVIGLWLLASGAATGTDRAALPWAVLAMFGTSVYSLSDKAATAHVPSFSGLLGFVSVGYLASWLAMTWRLHNRTGRWMPAQRINGPAMVIGGLCIGLAYALVIHAMRHLPSAEVVSLTNAGIVIATVLSILVFGERANWLPRLQGTLVITAGLGVLALR